jgi:thymidylate kinase
VLDGLFLHRDELRRQWDFSVVLEVPFSVSVARMARRDGSHPDPTHPSLQRYVQGQQLYFDRCRPWSRATVVVDNSRHPGDPERRRLALVAAITAAVGSGGLPGERETRCLAATTTGR